MTIALALAAPAHAATVKNMKMAYTLENQDGKRAVFTCRIASDGKCYLKVGVAGGAEARSLVVKQGEAVEIAVSNTTNAVCYAVDPDIKWPACLTADQHIDLNEKMLQATYKFSHGDIGRASK